MSDINFNELMKMISQMDKAELQSKLDEDSNMLNLLLLPSRATN